MTCERIKKQDLLEGNNVSIDDVKGGMCAVCTEKERWGRREEGRD